MTSKAFDIGAIEAQDTATCPIIGLDGNPLQTAAGVVEIELYGPGSAHYQRATAKLESAAQTRAFASLRGKNNANVAEEQRRAQVDKLVECTREVRGIPLNALEIYENPRLGYITNQVSKFVEDWGNFLPKPPKN